MIWLVAFFSCSAGMVVLLYVAPTEALLGLFTTAFFSIVVVNTVMLSRPIPDDCPACGSMPLSLWWYLTPMPGLALTRPHLARRGGCCAKGKPCCANRKASR